MAAVSVRRIEDITQALWGMRVSTGTVSDLNQKMYKRIDKWRKRPIEGEYPYVYQHSMRRYGLNGKEVHWEPEEPPTPEQWAELKKILKEYPAQLMIWEGTPNPSTVEELKNIGLDSLTFDPCGNVPETGDYLSVMRENALNLKKAFARWRKGFSYHCGPEK